MHKPPISDPKTSANLQEISKEHSSQILERVKGHNTKDMAVTQELSKLCNTNGDLMRDKQVLLRQKVALQQDAGIPQTQRNAFVGVLSHPRQNVVMTPVKQTPTTAPGTLEYICKTYRTVGPGAAPSYFRNSVIHNDIYRPCLSNFS